MLRPCGSAIMTVRTLVLMPDLERGPGTLAVNRLVAVALARLDPVTESSQFSAARPSRAINTNTNSLCLDQSEMR